MNAAGSEQSIKRSRARIANALATAYLPALPDLYKPFKPLFANTRRASKRSVPYSEISTASSR